MSIAPAKSFVILLREHLEAEIAVHRRLLALAEARGRALVADDRAALVRTNEEEAAPAVEAGRLRACRERLVLGLAERLGCPAKEVRLSKLIELLPEPNRRDLSERREELAALIGRLRDEVDRNQQLVRSSLSLVQAVLRAVIGGPEQAGGYDRRGGGGAGSRGGLVDARI